MSEFNKEQLYILLHNFFVVIGFLGGIAIFRDGYEYLQIKYFYHTAICFILSSIIISTSIWLFFDAFWKGFKPFIDTYINMIILMENEIDRKINILKNNIDKKTNNTN